jgi:hypothetical protein
MFHDHFPWDIIRKRDATWTPMVRRDHNYTGGYWEYVVSAFCIQVLRHLGAIRRRETFKQEPRIVRVHEARDIKEASPIDISSRNSQSGQYLHEARLALLTTNAPQKNLRDIHKTISSAAQRRGIVTNSLIPEQSIDSGS